MLSVSGDENVGYSGSGSFTQSGGTNNTHGLELGCGTGTRGSYNLSGAGVLNANGFESIGSAGRGSFTQSAGTNNTAFLQLGQVAGGNGTYNLNGGLLSCGQVLGGAGTSTFNFNGGVLQAAAGANSNFLSGLTTAYVKSGGATIDTNGQTVTINQTLLDGGGGGLSVAGGGTLTLANSNTYAGGTTLNGGWLVASNGTQGSATGSGPVAVYSGGLAAGPAGGTITGPVTLGVSAPSGIQPGAFFNPSSNILNLLGGLIIENGSECTTRSTLAPRSPPAQRPAGLRRRPDQPGRLELVCCQRQRGLCVQSHTAGRLPPHRRREQQQQRELRQARRRRWRARPSRGQPRPIRATSTWWPASCRE